VFIREFTVRSIINYLDTIKTQQIMPN